MSLSKIELVGFKSFMAPIAMPFREGITAIIGPNGCGKTNIVDAVRWVLGEQSARQLRGSKMESVIFNGTQAHKPMGYASVNLTINNERGQFPLDYAEITITRKVYRSGVSEYFINKAPCRLKDIRDLFADTGTGSHSYSVIEQEMIDWVLNDVHGERRLMFEEAAGIVKYRMRREEAHRKLALTDADLIRLEDILEELRTSVRSLKYQMAKARRYQIVRDRIRAWELIQLRRQLGQMLSEKRAADGELSQLINRTKNEDTSLADLERRVEEVRAFHLELERDRSELQNKRYEVRRRIDSSEGTIIQFTERQRQAGLRIEKAKREGDEADKRLAEIAGRIGEVDRHALDLEARVAQEEAAIGDLGGVYHELSEQLRALNARLIDAKQTQLDFLQDQVRAKSALEHHEGMLVELDARSAEAREQIAAAEREGAGIASERERAAAVCRVLEERSAALERERLDLIDALQSAENELLDGERRLGEKRAELGMVRSKHDLLQRMKENFEGFPGGARHLLANGDARVRGPLVEFLRVEERLKPAIEAALAGMLEGIVTGTHGDALALVRQIVEAKPGRVRLFAEDAIDASRIGARSMPPHSLGPLSSFITVEDPHRSLVENLLGDVYLFEDPDAALSFMTSEESAGAGAVTVSGISFSRAGGVYFGGGAAEELSLLGRSDDLERMREAIPFLEQELAALAAACDAARSERDRISARMRAIEAELRGLREECAARSGDLQVLERDHAASRERVALLMKAVDEIEVSRAETIAKIEEKKLSIELQGQQGSPSQGEGLEAELLSLQQRKTELEGSITERRVALASLRGALEKDREEQRGLAEMERQFSALVEERRREIDASTVELGELETAIITERQSVRALLEEEHGYETAIASLAGSLEERRAEAETAEKELKSRAADRERLFERVNETKITLSTIDTRMRDLVDKAEELYHEDVRCYLAGQELPLTEEEAAVTREMLERERRKLESLGPVNLAAVDEYGEKKTRLDFLEAQKADLQKAKGELVEAIEKINARARELFLETYECVRRNFRETFQILFEGGEADLSLSEVADPLEADIMISARPRGKRLQDISLLSGGERALTALALLFALYKAKPSPFCIFDEVDAPLDDANIQRFVRMLHAFKKETQFIVITHNKRTMEAAEQLYGVTMEERGVSRIVSVDFEGIEKVLKNRATAERVLVPSEVSSNN